MLTPFKIDANEAGIWWRTNTVAGAVLYRLMLLFIVGPLILVSKGYYTTSLVVFSFMIPYGLLLKRLAKRAVINLIDSHPQTSEEFANSGIISRVDQKDTYAD